MSKSFSNRIGEENINNFGSNMIIVKYRNNQDIDVYFPKYDWTLKNTFYSQFKKGEIKCPYEPRYCNRGYLGEGEYNVSENGKRTKYFDIWYNMLNRCYNDNFHELEPSYKNCEVEEYLLNFQNFAKWCEKSYYTVKNEVMCLDKDILIKGNNIYSRETCIFVPKSINSLFTKRQNNRGKCLIGINNNGNGFLARCNNGKGKIINLGTYSTPEEAFQVYKLYKENLIKQIADEYKSYIPRELYKAMYKYEVEIDD